MNYRGTPERSCRGLVDWPCKAVPARGELTPRARGNPSSRAVESAGEKSLVGSLESVRTVNRHRWARRAASGERVKRGQGTRHNDSVTSEEGVPDTVATFAVVAGSGRSESAQATV
jgi:hypothetical protein